MASEGRKDFVRVLLAYFLPPVGVFLQSGVGSDLVINIVLTFLGGIPGQVHAIWVIATTGEHGEKEADGMNTFISLLLACWLPPVGVLMKKGLGVPFVINLLLTVLLFWLPGAVHAAWVITHDE